MASWLAGWLGNRRAAASQVRAENNKAEGEAHSAAIGDQAAEAVEAARTSSDAQINRTRTDGPMPDGLRKQSQDVQSAIDAANGELP